MFIFIPCSLYINFFSSLSAAPIIHLQVSTVGDKVITLPKDSASLYASAWPRAIAGKFVSAHLLTQNIHGRQTSLPVG